MKKFYFVSLVILGFMLPGCGDDTQKHPALDVKILNWGPQSTLAGKPFNIQPSGESAIWFEMTGTVQPQSIEAWLGDKKLEGLSIASDRGGAILLVLELIAIPGKYPVYLTHAQSNKRIDIGIFEVLPNLTDVPNVKILKWGPQSTSVGSAFNKQPNGVSAIWFEMVGAVYPGSMEAWFGDTKLNVLSIASDRGGAILIPTNLLGKVGSFPVYLVHVPSKKRFDVGIFKVVR